VILLSQFAVPGDLQQKVLQWGVLGAVILRLGFIVGGAGLLHAFEWAVFVFGGLLLLTAIRLLVGGEHEKSFRDGRMMRAMTKVFPFTDDYRGGSFVVKEKGRRVATPLFAVLALIIVADLIFAVDSIPAIFAITADPFLVFTSNVFAILGLRSLYFALAGAIEKFRYLKVSLAAVLALVGGKMLAHSWLKEMLGPSFNLYLLLVVLSILAAGVAASWWRRDVPGSVADPA
jgi:tellurite resistance protein TerC